MRHLKPFQTFTHPTANAGLNATYTIPLTDTCVAGSKVVVSAIGGSQITEIRFGSSTGPLFTKRAQALSAIAISHLDAVAAGGETTLWVKVNGDENMTFTIWHTDLGAYIDSTAGTNTPGSGNDFQVRPGTPVTVTGQATVFGSWGVQLNTAADEVLKWRCMGPRGRLYVNSAHQPATGTKYIFAAGVADVDASHRFPVTGTVGQYQASSVWVNGTQLGHAAQVAYVDSSGVASNPAPENPIVAENSLPGTFQANWFLGGNATGQVAGYTDEVSYQAGDTVGFKVDSSGQPFRVEVYRLGHYGWETLGARQQCPHIVGTPATQPAPTVDSTLGSVSCAWSTTASWTVPTDACPGLYYVLFRRTDNTTLVGSHHFVVRGDPAGRATVVLPDCTYASYNLWGATTDKGARFGAGTQWSGRSLYAYGPDATNDASHRAYAVSFDRPYSCASTQVNTYIFDSDYPWIHWAEGQGYDLTYVSDVDLDKSPTMLTTAAQVVMLGHQEYITTNQYDAYRAVPAAGVNLIVNGSNIALWRVRFAAADTRRRTMICYKDSLSRDVTPGWSGTGIDPVSWTGTWRDTTAAGGRSNPDVRRENALTGQLFVLSAPLSQRFGVPAASKTVPCWRNNTAVQALTTGQTWLAPAGTIGDEGDAANGSAGQPVNLVNLCPTSVTGSTGANAAGTAYATTVTSTHGWTVYRHGSGALVANTGSWRAGQGITRWAQGAVGGVVTAVTVDWQNSWLAWLYDLGMVPVTVRSLRPGLDAAPTNPATGAPPGPRNRIAVAYGLTVPASSGLLAYILQDR